MLTAVRPLPRSGPVAGPRCRLVAAQHVDGSPPFALLGQRIVVRGHRHAVCRRADGEGRASTATGARCGRRASACSRWATARGSSTSASSSHYGGLVEARARALRDRAAGGVQRPFAARAVLSANVGPGARGQSVRLLQSELDVLHYAVPLSGCFDEGTGRALVAYRKMTGLARMPYAGTQVWSLLAHGRGRFPRALPAATAGTSRQTSQSRCWPRSNRAGGCARSTR